MESCVFVFLCFLEKLSFCYVVAIFATITFVDPRVFFCYFRFSGEGVFQGVVPMLFLGFFPSDCRWCFLSRWVFRMLLVGFFLPPSGPNVAGLFLPGSASKNVACWCSYLPGSGPNVRKKQLFCYFNIFCEMGPLHDWHFLL